MKRPSRFEARAAEPVSPDPELLAALASLGGARRDVRRHAAGRALVMAAAARARGEARGVGWGRWRRRIAVGALTLTGANLALGGVVALAAGAQPDSLLYGVKRAAEAAKLSLTFDPVDKARLELQIADRRAAEAASMAHAGHAALALDAARDATQLVREASQTLSGHPSAENEQALQHASAEARTRLEEVFAALENGTDPGASAAARSLDAAWSNGLGPGVDNAGGNPAPGAPGQGQSGARPPGDGTAGAPGNTGQGQTQPSHETPSGQGGAHGGGGSRGHPAGP